MSEIRCIVVNNKGERCTTTITVSVPVAEKVSYICKNHARAEQVRANNRNYDPVKDEEDKDLHFQDVQFDKNLGGRVDPITSPEGTKDWEHDDTSDRQ